MGSPRPALQSYGSKVPLRTFPLWRTSLQACQDRGVSPSVLHDGSPPGGCTQSAALVGYLCGILGKEKKMTRDKEDTESQEGTRRGWIRK